MKISSGLPIGQTGFSLSAVLSTNGRPGEAWPTPLQAPIADGNSISALPIFGGPAPVAISAVDMPKLGIGTANPTVHGGG